MLFAYSCIIINNSGSFLNVQLAHYVGPTSVKSILRVVFLVLMRLKITMFEYFF